MVNLSIEFEEKLKAYISEIEDKSPIEIVPVIVKKADSYTKVSFVGGLLLAYMPSLFLASFLPLWDSLVYGIDFAIWFFLSLLFSFVLRKLPFFSFFVPKFIQQQKVLQKAESLFLHEGVFETQERLGILVAVFEFERSVMVLADKGFNGHVESGYWSKLGATLANDFNHKNYGEEFFKALREIDREITPKFKHSGDNPNELSDDLRKR
ncbi:MAG: hypothetical protein R3A80_10480 [Bdellovibrionota bacterium]